MLGVYYGNAWGAKSQTFMSTSFHMVNGTRYPISKVFPGGVLSESALAKYGLPQLTGTFAFAMFMTNAAVRSFLCLYLAYYKPTISRLVL